MPNKLKVLHVIPSVSPVRGGPSKAVIEMVSALRVSGVDAEIATTNDHGSETLDVPFKQLTEHKGVPVRFFKRFSPNINAVREFAYSSSFKQWIKQHVSDYDIIHVHAIFSFCSTYAMYQARKQGVAYIVRPIGQLENWSLTQSNKRKRIYLDLIERKNLINANQIHFTAESEKTQALTTIPELSSSVIPLGIHMPEKITNSTEKMCAQWGLKKDTPTIVFLSRLHPKKGLELLISSLSQLTQTPYQLVIAGKGSEEYTNSLNATVTEHNLSGHCKFVGFVDGYEKNLLLQGADIFALTSHSENFGIAALEAMASGTAVLVSDEVALSEHVKKHNTGYITSLNKQEIESTLRTTLTDLESTREMGQNGYDLVNEQYQWSAISKKITYLYKKLS